MAVRRPHKRMKTVGRRAVRPKLGTSPSATAPLHTPWIPAKAGIAMALRRPNKRMKVGRWVGFFHRPVVLPLPTPPGFRPSPE